MNIKDKLEIFEKQDGKNAKIETTKQSLKITHECGCYMIEHFLDSPICYKSDTSKGMIFVKLCKEHYNN